MTVPLTLLTASSAAHRDRLLRQVLGRRPDLVVVAYDMPEVMTRAAARRRTLDATGVLEDEEVLLDHGCVTCAVREDAPPALVRVAEHGRWAEVLLALPVPVLPEAIALDHHGLRVVGATTVVDALAVLDQLSGDVPLVDLGLGAATTDRRTLAELVACQVEQSDVVALVHAERTPTAQARTVEALLAHLAPLARRAPVGLGGEGSDELVGPGRSTTAPDRQRLSVLAHELLAPTHRVATLVWRSDRPLHPQRLRDGLARVVAPVQRGRGHLQLAGRPEQVLRYESAGGSVSLGVVADAPSPLPCCELVLTGVDLDVEGLRRHLDECVLTDGEALGEDPFAGALGA